MEGFDEIHDNKQYLTNMKNYLTNSSLYIPREEN